MSPLIPNKPISSEPGSTNSPSSLRTIIPGFKVNLAVSGVFSLVLNDAPIPPSVDPMVSIKRMS